MFIIHIYKILHSSFSEDDDDDDDMLHAFNSTFFFIQEKKRRETDENGEENEQKKSAYQKKCSKCTLWAPGLLSSRSLQTVPFIDCGMCIWWFCNFFSVCFAFVHAYNNLAYGFMQNYRVFCVICSDALLNADYCCVENEEQKSKYSLFSFISAFRLVWCACVFSL